MPISLLLRSITGKKFSHNTNRAFGNRTSAVNNSNLGSNAPSPEKHENATQRIKKKNTYKNFSLSLNKIPSSLKPCNEITETRSFKIDLTKMKKQ